MRALECNQYYARAKRSKASKEGKKDKIGQNIRGEIELYNSFIQETTQNYTANYCHFLSPIFTCRLPQYKKGCWYPRPVSNSSPSRIGEPTHHQRTRGQIPPATTESSVHVVSSPPFILPHHHGHTAHSPQAKAATAAS